MSITIEKIIFVFIMTILINFSIFGRINETYPTSIGAGVIFLMDIVSRAELANNKSEIERKENNNVFHDRNDNFRIHNDDVSNFLETRWNQ